MEKDNSNTIEPLLVSEETKPEEKEDSKEISRKQSCYNVIVTVTLICLWITMGMFMELAGPTLKDFKLRMNTTYEALSSSYSGRSIGKFTGVVLGGFLVDKMGKLCYLFLAFALSAAAITVICLPWVQSLSLLWFCYFALGTCLGIINIAGQRIVLVIWADKAASPMHIVHLGYGVGGFLAPLIANPFLADIPEDRDVVNTTLSTVTYNASINSTSGIPDPISRIERAYLIVGIVTVVMAAIFYGYQFLTCRAKSNSFGKSKTSEKEKENKLEKKRTLLDMINPASCADGNMCFGITILALLFMRYFFLTGIDRLSGTFLRSFAIDQLRFSKDDASYVNTAYWICYAVGRLIAFIVARWVSVKVLLIVETILMVLTGIGMVAFAVKYQMALWVLAICTGLFMGPMFPTGIAWGDAYIEMTGLAITWTLLGSAFGGLAYLKLSGLAYDTYGPPSFTYIFLGTAIVVCLFDVIMTIAGVLKSRFTKNEFDLKKRETEMADTHGSVYKSKESECN